jgi:hypothetical protein
VSGPYDTAAQAQADAASLTAAIRAADPGVGPMTDAIRAARHQARIDYLTRALIGAGVELGEYDRRIAAWLADWETETLQVVVGWITRAHAPDGLSWRVYAQPEGGARWLVSAFAARKLAERYAERHPHVFGPLSIEHTTAADAVPLHWPSRGLRTTTSCHGEPLTVESFAAREADVTCPGCRALLSDETSAAPEQQITHHAVMRHGHGGPACGTSRFSELMARDTRAVNCPACLATLAVDANGGA